MPLDLGLVVREYLSQYPRARHFDVARIVIDQAVRLGVAQADFTGLPAKWQPINDYGAKVQAHVIDKDPARPVKLAQALANPLFPALDSALRSGRQIGLDELDIATFLMDFQEYLEEFYARYNVELNRAPEGFFDLRPRSTTLIPRSVLSGTGYDGRENPLLSLSQPGTAGE